MNTPIVTSILFGLVILGRPISNSPISTTNLLINPGAETGTIAGWTADRVGGNKSPIVDNGTFDRRLKPHGGKYDFYGAKNAGGTLSQTVTLVDTQQISAAAIDTGSLIAKVSFYEQGLNKGQPSDEASVTLVFLDSASAKISSATTDLVDSHKGAWALCSATLPIPKGSRKIIYRINFIRHPGADNYGSVDDTSLTVMTKRGRRGGK